VDLFHGVSKIAYDQFVNGAIGAPDEEDDHTFAGEAGDSEVVFLDNRGPGMLSLRLSRGGTALDFAGYSNVGLA
jgi:hypothetical protein